MSEEVTSLILKLIERYNVKIFQVYALTFSPTDERVERLYEDKPTTIVRNQTRFLAVRRNFNAKVGIRKLQ